MTNRLWLLAVVLCASALTPAVRAQEDPLASPKLRIEWDDFKKQYDRDKVVVIDVRDKGSYEAGHIPGALSVPLDQVETRLAELKKIRKPIVLYCA